MVTRRTWTGKASGEAVGDPTHTSKLQCLARSGPSVTGALGRRAAPRYSEARSVNTIGTGQGRDLVRPPSPGLEAMVGATSEARSCWVAVYLWTQGCLLGVLEAMK